MRLAGGCRWVRETAAQIVEKIGVVFQVNELGAFLARARSDGQRQNHRQFLLSRDGHAIDEELTAFGAGARKDFSVTDRNNGFRKAAHGMRIDGLVDLRINGSMAQYIILL